MSYLTLRNGEQIYYLDTGKGERADEKTIVMLHGWTSSHEVFEAVLPGISSRARCIIYDHRGHGKSKNANKDQVTLDTLAEDLEELLSALDLHNIILLGWSMGAATVMDYTALYGCDRLSQVVLCDMTPRQKNDAQWKLGLYQGKYTEEDDKGAAEKDFYTIYKEFALAAIPKLQKVPGFLLKKPLKNRLAECDEGVMRSLSRSMKEKDFRDCVGKITVPVTYFYAVPGSLFSPELEGWYREHVTSPYRSVAFENSTHMLISDNPEKFSQEVLKVIGV